MPTFCVFSKAAINCHVLDDVVHMDTMRYEKGRFVSVIKFTGKKSVKKVTDMLKRDEGLQGLLGKHIKVKKSIKQDSMTEDIMKGVRECACVTVYGNHHWLVKDGVPLSDAELNTRFKELVYWYMESFETENGDDMHGWVVVLAHPRFGGEWLVTCFAEEMFKKKSTLEECMKRLNEEFDTEFEVLLSKFDKARCIERDMWIHTMTNNYNVEEMTTYERTKAYKGGEAKRFVKVDDNGLQLLKTMVEDEERLGLKPLKDLVKERLEKELVKEKTQDEEDEPPLLSKGVVIEILD